MNAKLLSILTSVIIFVGLLFGNSAPANAISLPAINWIAEAEVTDAPVTDAPVTEETATLLKKLEGEIIPQISSVLTPEQQISFADKITAGTSFRKAFKSITLTPAQKTKLSAVFKTIPQKDIFATLTPAQKKQLFLQKKQIFIPTAEEIGEKINAGMKMAKEKSSSLAPTAEEIGEKINAGMKMAKEKSSFAPSVEDIVDKINTKFKAIGLEE
jgi:hypothetical protein